MAYYDDPYIYHIPARECVDYWNEPYSWNTMREMPMPPMPPMPPPKPQPPMPPMPEPPPVVCPQPDKDYYTWPANLEKALQLIEEAVMGEAGDEKFYEAMMKLCDKEDKGIFEGIIADERKHAQLFRLFIRVPDRYCPKPIMLVKLPRHAAKGCKRQFSRSWLLPTDTEGYFTQCKTEDISICWWKSLPMNKSMHRN